MPLIVPVYRSDLRIVIRQHCDASRHASGTIRLGPGINPDAASGEIRKIAGRIGKEVPIEVQTYNKLFKRVLQQDRIVPCFHGFLAYSG
jgi:hypothetical protein